MHRRLYILVPTLNEAEKIADELLLKRICIHHIHAITKEGQDLGTLPQATLIQRLDILHSLLIGAAIGGVIGIIAGLIVFGMLNVPLGGGLLATTLIGAVLGAFFSSMMGLMLPNVHLKHFRGALDEGQYLLMIDVPKERVAEFENLIKVAHPQAIYKGIEPTIPGFP